VNGRDVTVDFKTAAEVGKSYPETSIRVKPNTTSISEDKNILEMAKEQIDLSTMFKRQSYDEMESMLQQWLETGKVEDGKTETADVSQPSTPAQTTSKASNVKEAFDDLFND
jgi:hypothetical protein